MGRRVRVRPAAYEQLREIRAYGEEVHGSRQAQKYQDALEAEFEKLALNPQLGPTFEGSIRLWPWPSGQHQILYEPNDSGIDVLAVERQGRDLSQVAEYLHQQCKRSQVLEKFGRIPTKSAVPRTPGKDIEPES